MKKQLYTSMLVLVITTSNLGTVNTLAAPMDISEQVIPLKNVDSSQFSSSLRKLGEQAALLRAYALVIGDQSTINLPQVPTLQDTQQLVQDDINKEWVRKIFNRRLVVLNEKNRGFINVFNTYIKQQDMDGIKEGLNDSKITKEEIQQDINELEEFKKSLDQNNTSFAERINKAEEILNGQSGRITELKKNIQAINTDMQKDLETISSVPGILLNSSTDIGIAVWKLLYPTVKGATKAMLENMIAANKALGEVKDKAENDAKAAGKTDEEIRAILQEVENNFKTSPQGLALESTTINTYDFMDKIDLDQLKKIITAATAGNTALEKQKNAILNLAAANHKIYTETRDLQAAEIQTLQILFIKDKVDMFAEQINKEIELLKKHQKDWIIIEQVITELPEKPTTLDLKTLKMLCRQLDEQTKDFTRLTN
ncbi:hypothetical protein CN345_04430 [Bacillus thuringiensis]|uniref:HBL/NHE enterotoxin family protein n=1 Tax=Bacillus thuringiensis TaxID=1428 RepID=UPI000BF4EE06|nr:HBL/NHE enterotoxin family protein [Bacillus thuringiensis]PEZ44437.1 hypothetical protein CN345_04430 [Bacillus thuringiensis]PGY62910.1 hypothetical protein COE09_03555 [Bacillus thuringiensis]